VPRRTTRGGRAGWCAGAEARGSPAHLLPAGAPVVPRSPTGYDHVQVNDGRMELMDDALRTRSMRQRRGRAQSILLTGVLCTVLLGASAAAQDGDGTRIREGNRVRRGDLPHTAARVPVWLSPLVVVAGLACTSAGIALLLRANEREDVALLERGSRGRRGPRTSPSPTPPPPPPPPAAPLPRSGQAPSTTASRTSSVSAAWEAIGVRRRAPGARAAPEREVPRPGR
jgi:hypothetical protein